MKKKNKREADWTTKHMHRIPVGVWEVKLAQPAHPDRIYYKQFAKHQISKLLQAKHQKFTYKIRDEGVSQKPFDGITVEKCPAWCVLVYGADVYCVDIDTFYSFCMREGNVVVKGHQAQLLGFRI